MNKPLADLVDLLGLETLEDTLFRGRSEDLGWGAVYGGQVLGQALSAAEQTVPEDRSVHSLHAYFLRKGDPSRPVIYDVDCIRDGRSFTTRRVTRLGCFWARRADLGSFLIFEFLKDLFFNVFKNFFK